MLVHTVYFWLDPTLDADTVAAFEAGLDTLVAVPSVRHGFWGRPAATARPVIDRTYSYGLAVIFDDLAGHDAYQIDPIHQAFIDRFAAHWIKVAIYDTQT